MRKIISPSEIENTCLQLTETQVDELYETCIDLGEEYYFKHVLFNLGETSYIQIDVPGNQFLVISNPNENDKWFQIDF